MTPNQTNQTPSQEQPTSLPRRFIDAVRNYPNGPRGLGRSFALAAVPGVASAIAASMGASGDAILVTNLVAGAGAAAVGGGAAAAGAGAVAAGAGAAAVGGAAAAAGAAAGAGAAAVAGAVGAVGAVGAACMAAMAADELSPRRVVTGTLAGALTSAVISGVTVGSVLKQERVAKETDSAQKSETSETLVILQPKGACRGYEVGEIVELKDGRKQGVITLPSGCNLP